MLNKQIKRFDILLFLVIGIAVTTFLFSSASQKEQLQIDSLTKISQTQFNTVLYGEQQKAERFYDDHAHNIAWLLQKAQNASAHQQDKIRQQLLNDYQQYFDNAKIQGLGVLHIFDAEGRSFLRFHQPDIYGDDLTAIRPSIHNLVTKQRYTQGFEIGRVKEAYRFVFPLFYDGEFIGGIEFSLDFKAISKQLKELFATQSQQLLLTAEIKRLLFEDKYQKIFQPSALLADYSIARRHQINERFFSAYIDDIKDHCRVKQDCHKEQFVAFFSHINQQPYHLRFIPLKNTHGNFTGYILSANPLSYDIQASIQQAKWFEITLFWALWLSLFWVWRRKVKSEEFSHTLLDTQSSMLVLTQGDRLIYANRALLSFVGFKSYADFINEYDCICDLFINESGYLQKDVNGVKWTEYIIRHPSKEHKVKMIGGTNRIEHILEVTLEPFPNSTLSLVTLHDITELECNRLNMLKELQHDPLTNTLNRRAFDIITSELSSRFKPKFSAAIFDIDFFKQVNDTHGHDVGDQVLISLSEIVTQHIRSTDYLIRWGGEEFIILLDKANLEHAEIIANQLKTRINRHDFPHSLRISCSFGVSEYRVGEPLEKLIKRCDEALYYAKTHGRNKVVTR